MQSGMTDGFMMPGWPCTCGVFNSAEKEWLTHCRACGDARYIVTVVDIVPATSILPASTTVIQSHDGTTPITFDDHGCSGNCSICKMMSPLPLVPPAKVNSLTPAELNTWRRFTFQMALVSEDASKIRALAEILEWEGTGAEYVWQHARNMATKKKEGRDA